MHGVNKPQLKSWATHWNVQISPRCYYQYISIWTRLASRTSLILRHFLAMQWSKEQANMGVSQTKLGGCAVIRRVSIYNDGWGLLYFETSYVPFRETEPNRAR